MADSTRVRFTFATEASLNDPKTTVTLVKRMQLEDDDDCYAFPAHLESAAAHDDLFNNATVKLAKKSLTARHMHVKPWVILPKELAAKYLDATGNPVFDGLMLQPAPPYAPRTFATSTATAPTPTPTEESKSLSSLLKDAVIERFGKKPINAAAWIDRFETECTRLKVPDTRRWEAIRLFLDDTASEWYQTALSDIKGSTWEIWRNSFLDSFSQKGWASAREAFKYRFYSGSYADYAIRKLNLLIAFNPKMDELTRIAHIVIGLPYSVQERLDRSEIETTSKLFSKLNSYEHQTRFAHNTKDSPSRFSITSPRKSADSAASRNFAPCAYCVSKGYSGASHSESECRTKKADKFRPHEPPPKPKSEGKLINLTEVHDRLDEIFTKSKNE